MAVRMVTIVDVARTDRSAVIHNAVQKADRKIRVQSHSDIPEKVVFGDLILVATSVGILIINTTNTILAGVTSDFNRKTGYPFKAQLSALLGLALFYLYSAVVFRIPTARQFPLLLIASK